MAELTRAKDLAGGYLGVIRGSYARQKRVVHPAQTLEEWGGTKKVLRETLLEAWGGFPERANEPRVKKIGELKRDGYRVEKLLLETMPEVWMTALAYVPEKSGKKLPAVLNVHGHWAGAKQDPVVQARCQGLARLGFFVLAVDAFGAGDRAVGTKLGEYHGSLTAATLFPTGYTLSGIQVFENMRAVDYLLTRPEVDGEKIGVTGASGGGNQSMYVGAYDERIKCVVPVCSVGSYKVYLGIACCMCEVVPGAVEWTEEAGILSLTAPRALMVISATKDAIQFSVGEAAGSLGQVRPIYGLFSAEKNLKHAVFESGHDYNQAMREMMYGWMTLHLKGEGEGLPISEPKLVLEDREELRCFPGDSRPADFVTLPRFAAREGRRFLSAAGFHGVSGRRGGFLSPDVASQPRFAVAKWMEEKRQTLREKLLGGFPTEIYPLHVRIERTEEPEFNRVWFQSEAGLEVFADVHRSKAESPWGVVVHLSTFGETRKHPEVVEMLKQGWNVAILNPRGVGELSPAGNLIANAADHNTAEWGLWSGKPLVGQWTWDALRLLEVIRGWGGKETHVVGLEQGGVCALMTGIYATRIANVKVVNGLASYVSEMPYKDQLLGSVVPGVLREVGDVSTLAGLVGSEGLVIAGGRKGGGDALSEKELREMFGNSAGLRGEKRTEIREV